MSEADDVQAAEAVLNRTTTPVAGDLGAARLGRAAAITIVAVVCGLLVLAPWKREDEPEGAKAAAPRQIVAFEPARTSPTLDNPGVDAPSLFEEPLEDEAAESRSLEASGVRASPAPAARPRPSPVLAWSARARPQVGAVNAALLAASEASEASEASLDDGYARLRKTGPIETAKARRLGDRNLLLTAGAAIPCTLQTAMDSTLPGQVVCLLGRDVWSDNGAVVLMEKGARILGEYRQGLRTGEGRLFVLWTRVVTPGGVAVDLSSPAADALGRSGFDGDVDTRFWKRFGGAILLSVVDDAAVAAVGRDSDRQMARLPSEAAAIALDRSIDLPPILRKPQGSSVSIMVARDLDFSEVYGLAAADQETVR